MANFGRSGCKNRNEAFSQGTPFLFRNGFMGSLLFGRSPSSHDFVLQVDDSCRVPKAGKVNKLVTGSGGSANVDDDDDDEESPSTRKNDTGRKGGIGILQS